jgi:predicted nucleic acid-binding protein
MEQGFLMDSNVVIDYFGNKLPTKAASFIDNLPAVISVITRIEILGWYNATTEQLNKLQSFVQQAVVCSLTETIIKQTILLRQMHRIKLPDAIVAATALEKNKTLITRNVDDFKNIPGLNLLNPWNM